MNKIKYQHLQDVRFKCNNLYCNYKLSYDEILLGTHELEQCDFLKIKCEGCGKEISKHELIKHDAFECPNPMARCRYSGKVVRLKDLLATEEIAKRSIKMEYIPDDEAAIQNQPAENGNGQNPLKRSRTVNTELANDDERQDPLEVLYMIEEDEP